MYYWKEEVGRHAQILFYKKKVWNNFFSVSSLWIFALQEWRLSNEMEFFFLCNRKQCNDVKDSNVSPVKNGIQDPKCRGFLDFRSL